MPDERADDYIAKARRAEIEAAAAKDPKAARQWRDLAETYRNIAASLARSERDRRASSPMSSDQLGGDVERY